MKRDWRRFVFSLGTSNKFWEIMLDDCIVWVRYGRIGTSGSKQVKEFNYSPAAAEYYYKKIEEKNRKGYVEAKLKSAPSRPKIPEQAKPPARKKTRQKSRGRASVSTGPDRRCPKCGKLTTLVVPIDEPDRALVWGVHKANWDGLNCPMSGLRYEDDRLRGAPKKQEQTGDPTMPTLDIDGPRELEI